MKNHLLQKITQIKAEIMMKNYQLQRIKTGIEVEIRIKNYQLKV